MNRDVFHAISDPTRRAILKELLKESQNVNSLSSKFDMTRQAVSLHLKLLEECNVINVQQDGRQRLCSLRFEELQEVQRWLKPFKEIWEARFDSLDELLTD
ncbi:MAG: winged helix-turn-helix transcriptional regulator [Flavobacteriia bacterium]|nr:winged helix-turn-helix transcriptional regulator [Flavobacteriia bacterium]